MWIWSEYLFWFNRERGAIAFARIYVLLTRTLGAIGCLGKKGLSKYYFPPEEPVVTGEKLDKLTTQAKYGKIPG